ncbi:enoyl-CoA hydratase-related protein, partial [Steroidobacter sp.]|uniref:enoyl-CoA hydratase-related protein n=1 Tax=Steroidobacter sp. TaxID=1978227 RepID=UPI001A553241
MSSASYEVRGNIAVITLDSPPVNSLEYAVRVGIVAGIDRAQADPEVAAIVLIGSGRAFSGGADIREIGTPQAHAEPHLATVISIVESARIPVIAALGGLCLGGGLELALAAHFRVALRDAAIGLPEVKLGLLPGAGGTQRLPRLIGIEAATNFIVSGETLRAEQFADAALFDAFASEDLLAAALDFAAKVVAEARPLKRARDIGIEYPNQQAYFQFARNMVRPAAGKFPAPLKCIDAVQAACGPFEAGLRVEHELFTELEQTSESRALRHAFFGARAAAKIADIGDEVASRPIARVGVIGAGTMGGGIAMNFLNAGLPVVLVEMNQAALDRGVATIWANYESSVRKGKLGREAVEQRMALLTTAVSFDAIAACDLIVEAVFE